MKSILFVLVSLFTLQVNAQWIVKKVDNGFDAPKKIAYTNNPEKYYLRLESVDGTPYLYMGGEYFCGEGPAFVEFSFRVNNVNKTYGMACPIVGDEQYLILSDNMRYAEFLNDFKSATVLKLRISDFDCTETDVRIYTFGMSGSTAALKYITTP